MKQLLGISPKGIDIIEMIYYMQVHGVRQGYVHLVGRRLVFFPMKILPYEYEMVTYDGLKELLNDLNHPQGGGTE